MEEKNYSSCGEGYHQSIPLVSRECGGKRIKPQLTDYKRLEIARRLGAELKVGDILVRAENNASAVLTFRPVLDIRQGPNGYVKIVQSVNKHGKPINGALIPKDAVVWVID